MTSVERVFEYTELPPEAPLESVKDKKPATNWPEHGVISTENASFKYTENGSTVLRNLRFCIQGQEKVRKKIRRGVLEQLRSHLIVRIIGITVWIQKPNLDFLIYSI